MRCLLFLLGLLLPFTCVGQVIDSINYLVEEGRHKAEIRFNSTISYQWHFPRTANTDFIIAVRPVGLTTLRTEQVRERTVIPAPMRDVISEIYVEPESSNELHLIMITPAATDIEVQPGKDGKSLIIGVTPTAKPVPCPK